MVAIISVVFGLLILLYGGSIWNDYLHNLPRTPDPTSGRVFPRNIHGIVIFQTHSEKLRLDLIDNIGWVIFMLGMLVGALEERRWRRTAGKNMPPMPKGWQPSKPG